MGDIPIISQSRHLSWNEYIDSRNVQDEQINEALREIRGNVIILDTRIAVMQSDIEVLKTSMREVTGEITRNSVLLRNSLLRNPLLPICPILTYQQSTGVVYPKSFPKNAHEFYLLKTASSVYQRKMLDYLARFYDYLGNDAERIDCEDVVEFLEGILGLYEPNFGRFKQRAKNHRARHIYQPMKRPQYDLSGR